MEKFKITKYKYLLISMKKTKCIAKNVYTCMRIYVLLFQSINKIPLKSLFF